VNGRVRKKLNPDTISEYGIKILLGNHKAVRRLKQSVRPLEHGHKIWTSSWLLIDYLKKSKTVSGARVLDLGCGWGLAGIYCAKKLKADVVWADIDSAVHPYLCLMAETNKVTANFLNLGIEQVGRGLLQQVDVIIASDICFCDTLIDPLRRLINRAKAACVKQVLISDPGRWPFDDLAELLAHKKGVELLEWETHRPRDMTGKILKINLSTP
jgi:predicted nicotinamide N-methyase